MSKRRSFIREALDVVNFEQYSKSIHLPYSRDPEGMRINFNGFNFAYAIALTYLACARTRGIFREVNRSFNRYQVIVDSTVA